eukprot:c14346_g1_i2.p2 GENE.c14346_g1_i2~~c14346_g1_i2.p2  ORF type:complete len:178 (+),score=45.57 c14346_g1_i2:1168-1701(+)
MEYLRGLDASTLIKRYPQLDVWYLAGELDDCNADHHDDCPDNGMAKFCQAMMQGFTRLQRARNYYNSLGFMYNTHNHHLNTIPNVSHDAIGVFTSVVGRHAIFSNENGARANSGKPVVLGIASVVVSFVSGTLVLVACALFRTREKSKMRNEYRSIVLGRMGDHPKSSQVASFDGLD